MKEAKLDRHRQICRLVRWCLTFCFLSACSGVYADTIRIAVASNFANTLRDIADTFEQQTGHSLKITPGSTGKHFAQISNGAPFDIFLAADKRRPALLEKQGLGVPGSRFTYALGRLVLWSPLPGKVDTEGNVLTHRDIKRLAIANPQLAPYGRAARDVLEARGLWKALQAKMVYGENVAQAFQFVASGNAELGFIAFSQLVRHGKSPEGSWWVVPSAYYQPIEQQALLLRETAATRAFMLFLQSPQTRADIKARGYGFP